uniref:hypothetical protein n=1 Tax=Aerococcus urinaeequi TaxID=51665 RepID=UPI003529FE35
MSNSENMHYYEAKPKNGRLTAHHKKELQKAGFVWAGLGWITQAERPPKVWGCTVRVIKPKTGPIVIKTEQDWYKFLKKTFGF